MDFWEKINVNVPQRTPDDEDVAQAYRTIADFPSVNAQLADVFRAVQTIRAIPEKEPEQELLLRRYGKEIEKIFSLAQKLSDKMDRDFTAAAQYDEDEEGKGE
jgi:hypothetical protein